ncbi:MAG TPA: alkaline phosphatase, partial [Chthoniobacterales bacterium]|nr:alkaline phosphatase [Chthoniobacterales bacterium]
MARAYLRGTEDGLTIDSLPQSALLKNHSLDSLIPDQAAAASALATGTKCRNGSLAVDAEGKGLQNLLELARENGRMTGLVTNALLTDHVPAAFYAQTSTPDNRDELARTLVEAAGIDVVLGGGAAEFLPVRKAGRRADERDLILDLRARGYDLVRDREELDAVPRWRRAKLFGLFSPGELAFADEIEARADQ